jgi:hypothetical protein
MTSRFVNGGACALTWESFPDDSLAGCGGTGDIAARRHFGATVRVRSFIGQWSPSAITARRPQEIGAEPLPSK